MTNHQNVSRLNSPELIISFWEEYRNSVFGGKLPFHQERDCSLCFYSGLMQGIMALSAISAEARDVNVGSDMIEGLVQNLKTVALLVNLNRDPEK